MKKGNIAEVIYYLIFTCIAAFAMLFSVCDAFIISYNAKMLYLFAYIFALITVIILYSIKKYRIAVTAGIITVGEFFLMAAGRNAAKESIGYILETAEMQFRIYIEEGAYARIVENSEQTWGLLLILCLFTGISAFGLIAVRRTWCTAIMMGISFALPFLVGTVPEEKTLILILVTVLGAVFGKMGGARKGNIVTASLLALFIGAAAFLTGIPLLEQRLIPVLEDRDSLREHFDEFWSGDIRNILDNIGLGNRAAGGVNDGKLGAYDGLDQDNSVHLKVKTEEIPEGKLYIRGFVGSEYTGRSWKRAKEREFDIGEEIEIENVKANRKYRYHTYPDYTPKEWKEEGSDYEESVRKQYLSVPKNVKDAFSEVVANNIVRTRPENVSWEIANLLSETTSYSLNPGKTPSGKDFAEYFFFESREGYCTHYATTAAIMFRMKDIPSRYVGGYVVGPNEFKLQSDGTFLAEVTGEMAHAWAEIYVPGQGWLPQETTPGYTGDSIRESSEERVPVTEDEPDADDVIGPEDENEPDNPDRQNEENDPDEPEGQGEPGGTDSDGRSGVNSPDGKKKEAQRGWFLFAGCTILLIIAGTIFVIVRKKQKRKLQEEGYNEKTKRAFYRIYDKLVAQGTISKESELDEAFIEKMCEQYPNILREDIEKLPDIVYRANYGRNEVEKEEYRTVRRILLLLEKKG